MENIKNIIFDLGGVLLDIDFKRTFKAFETLGVPNFEALYSQHHADPFFADFEMGRIPTHEFFEKIRHICGCPLTDEQIRDAWNALLIGFPQGRAEWLFEIRTRYNIYLFSNTNIIHYQWFSRNFEEATGMDLNAVFVKAYYSHEMGQRKPDPASFHTIIEEQHLNVAETLFIDDTLKNAEASRAAGLQTVHLMAPAVVTGLGL